MVFEKNLTVLLESIEDCLANRRLLPCLILIYSSIDIVSSLEPGRATGSAFMAWTDKYLLKAISLPCTPSDLWGARCGILHTFSGESDMSKRDTHVRSSMRGGTLRPQTSRQPRRNSGEMIAWFTFANLSMDFELDWLIIWRRLCKTKIARRS